MGKKVNRQNNGVGYFIERRQGRVHVSAVRHWGSHWAEVLMLPVSSEQGL